MALLADVGGAPATGTAPGCGGGGLSLLVPCAAVVGVGAGAGACSHDHFMRGYRARRDEKLTKIAEAASTVEEEKRIGAFG